MFTTTEYEYKINYFFFFCQYLSLWFITFYVAPLLNFVMADGEKVTSMKVNNNSAMKTGKSEKRSENYNHNEKGSGDNEDAESLEEQPLDIGEHYLVRRSDDTWRKSLILFLFLVNSALN